MFEKIKAENEDLQNGRAIVIDFFQKYCKGTRLLDIGVYDGKDLKNIQRVSPIPLELHGIDWYASYDYLDTEQVLANDPNIKVFKHDIEKDKLPFPDQYFDCVIINQSLEHMKQIFFVFSEVSRILKPLGILIIGVPNLASYLCRIRLLMGKQPPHIKVFDCHTRGYTKEGLRDAVERGSYFKLVDFRGSDFVPFPWKINIKLAKLFPNLCNSIYFCFCRTAKKGNYISVLENERFKNNYYLGEDYYLSNY